MNVDRDRNMALKPSYNDKLYLPGLSNTEILILALEASQKLEWNIEEVTPEGIRFEVPFSIRSHGEAITFTIEKGSDGEVSVRSQSSSVQFVDYGKNRKNIQKLRETMEEIKTSLTPEELTQKAKDFEEECNRPLTEEEKAYLEEEKKRNSFLSFFIPRKGFIATPILIDINILVFIVMTQQTEFCTCHQYQTLRMCYIVHQRSICFGFKFPFVVLNPSMKFVHVVLSNAFIVRIIEIAFIVFTIKQ